MAPFKFPNGKSIKADKLLGIMDTTLSIRIDKELVELLELVARRTGRSKSELVREALRRQLSVESFQHLRKKLLPYGEVHGWRTDEDVFRGVS